MNLCIRCGSWKQSAAQKCGCGFAPVPGSLDEAKSYVLSEQFRSPESLMECERAIRAGEEVAFRDEELSVARRIGDWNAAVTISFLVSAVFLGLLIGTVVARSALWVILAAGALSATGLVAAFALMRHVDRMVRAAR